MTTVAPGPVALKCQVEFSHFDLHHSQPAILIEAVMPGV